MMNLMPLDRKWQAGPGVTVGIWRIEEPEGWFTDRLGLYQGEREVLQGLKGERRREWLAARMLAGQLTGGSERLPCLNDDTGKPYFQGSSLEVSLSHSNGLVAAMISPGQRIGVDIQSIQNRMEQIAPRFMNEEELGGIDENHRIDHIHVYWGAKECLYKADSCRRLDLRQHIRIDSFPFREGGGGFAGSVLRNGTCRHFLLKYEKIASHMLVYAIED
jgi:4'-phosphopantetheinyl transferase